MSDKPELSKFQQRLAERREREQAEAAAAKVETPPAFEFDADLIPEDVYERTEDQKELDDALDRIDVIMAYRRWCGKMVPTVGTNQTESIMISCPIPGHVDSDPSAWINTEKQTWFCGGCQQGGDKFDIAAYWLGFPNPGYKEGQTFHLLREKMAEDFGYTLHREPGGSVSVTAPVIEPEPEAEPVAPVTPEVIVNLFEDDFDEIKMPSLDWKPIAPQHTFLHAYMEATKIDDAPEEYHFFHALVALGFALGRDVTLFDSVPVYSNLFICTLGRSGIGKSKARYHLDQLLNSVLPHDWSDPGSRGVRKINAPGSAESLIHSFDKPVFDPSNPKDLLYHAPIRGLIDFNELSALMSRTNRTGSAMKPTLMQFYDMEKLVQTSSMTHGSKEAWEPFASAVTTSQPKALRGLIGDSDDASGFLNRWLFVPGTEKKRFSVGGTKVDMEGARKPLEDIVGWAATFKTQDQVEWSEEAVVMWDEFFHMTVERDKKASDNDLIVRIDLLLKKLMLLFAANRHEKTLSKQSVMDAIYMYPYLKASYGIPEGQIGNTLVNEVNDAIIHTVQKIQQRHGDGRGASVREIRDNLKRKKYPPKMLYDSIDVLMKLGVIEEQTTVSGQVGRPTKRYKYVV